jgi:transposase
MKYEENFRSNVALQYLKTGDAKSVSKQFKVPLSTVYRWGDRQRLPIENSLKKKTTRPKSFPNKTNLRIEKVVISIWYSIKFKRNYSNVKRVLNNKGIKLSLPTIKKIIDRI